MWGTWESTTPRSAYHTNINYTCRLRHRNVDIYFRASFLWWEPPRVGLLDSLCQLFAARRHYNQVTEVVLSEQMSRDRALKLLVMNYFPPRIVKSLECYRYHCKIIARQGFHHREQPLFCIGDLHLHTYALWLRHQPRPRHSMRPNIWSRNVSMSLFHYRWSTILLWHLTSPVGIEWWASLQRKPEAWREPRSSIDVSKTCSQPPCYKLLVALRVSPPDVSWFELGFDDNNFMCTNSLGLQV
jgi:hypothetical protein